MHLQSDDYEIVAFFGLIVIFSICERLWPAHRVDRFREIKLDILSFAFALAANRLISLGIRHTIGDVTPAFLQGTVAWLQALPGAVKIIAAIFMADFIIYWIHRAQHRFGFLWRTHMWHHSIEEMYWFSGFRTSFFHSLLNNIPQVVVPVTIFQLSPVEAGIGYSFGIFIQFVEHTNWRLSFGPLNWLLVTPDYHRIHHTATPPYGKNLAGTFRIWDKWFGTYVNPDKVDRNFPLGLNPPPDPKKIPRMLAGV
ncbi:MAG TPA: sterol desaturase family protein [Verrucomicrobiales bacterium]|nr:sterol desaturase family protein [Verrucomicrobiales bacterium]